MTSQDYRKRLTFLGRILRRLVQALLDSYNPRQPVTDAQLADLTNRIYPVVMRTREQMRVAALDLHEETTGRRPIVDPQPYPRPWLQELLKQKFQIPWNQAIQGGHPVDKKKATEGLQAVVQHTAEYAARRTTLYAIENDAPIERTERDERDTGYARVIQGEYTCAWCIMLASRGPVYTKQEYDAWQANHQVYMDEFHFKCDCILVPVERSREKEWDGYDEWKTYEHAWARITKGYAMKDAVNAWRRHFREAERRGVDPITMPRLDPNPRRKAA